MSGVANAIRVFPTRTKWTPTDDLAFVGEPPPHGFRPTDKGLTVYVSATFTWDRVEAERLCASWGRFYETVLLGGPAYEDPGGPFEPGVYIKPGVTITSRGCPRRCPWCFVPQREGALRELPIRHGWIVQDNNLLACRRQHVEGVFEMLRAQPRAAVFSGGLDATLLEPWHVDYLGGIRVHEMWVACDTPSALKALERAAELLAAWPARKKRCYALIGWRDGTVADAARRLERIYELGFLPFAQLYRGPDGPTHSPEWRELARKWSRPAAYRGRRTESLGDATEEVAVGSVSESAPPPAAP